VVNDNNYTKRQEELRKQLKQIENQISDIHRRAILPGPSSSDLTLLVSTAEPTKFTELFGDKAISSTLCEEVGADILAFTALGKLGIQRKEFPSDFVSSIEDGRLIKEVHQLRDNVKFPVLIKEGRGFYDADGYLLTTKNIGNGRIITAPSKYTKTAIRNMIRSIYYVYGVRTEESESMEDTIKLIYELVDYIAKNRHVSLESRQKLHAEWGIETVSDRDLFLAQGLPGVGPKLAESICSITGRIPWKWDITKDQLANIRGLGKGKVDTIWNSLPAENKKE
jgi:ERCC4-type nuclease